MIIKVKFLSDGDGLGNCYAVTVIVVKCGADKLNESQRSRSDPLLCDDVICHVILHVLSPRQQLDGTESWLLGETQFHLWNILPVFLKY